MPVGILADGDGLNRASGAGHERHEAGAFQLGPQAGHQARTRGAANGLLTVVVFKDHAAARLGDPYEACERGGPEGTDQRL